MSLTVKGGGIRPVPVQEDGEETPKEEPWSVLPVEAPSDVEVRRALSTAPLRDRFRAEENRVRHYLLRGPAGSGGVVQLADSSELTTDGVFVAGEGFIVPTLPGGRQFHPEEIQLLSSAGPGFRRFLRGFGLDVTSAEAQRFLAQVAYARINPGAAEPEPLVAGNGVSIAEHVAIDYLGNLGRNRPAGPVPMSEDPNVQGSGQIFPFSSSSEQRVNSKIFATTLVTHPEFYARNRLIRDLEGAPARMKSYAENIATADAWTAAAPFIGAGVVAIGAAPTLVSNGYFFVLSRPGSAIEGAELVGGFLLGDALPTGLALGAPAMAALASQSDIPAWRLFRNIFNTTGRQSGRRVQGAVADAVDAGARQKAIELANGTIHAGAQRWQTLQAKGRIGEAAVEAFVRKHGDWEVLGSLKNASDNGIDLVARGPDGRIIVIEVKTTTTLKRQNPRGNQRHPQRIVGDILAGTGPYKNLTSESAAVLKDVQAAIKAGASVETRWAMVYIDDQYDVLGLVIDKW